MSRNHKDAVGGHVNHFLSVGMDGVCVNSPRARRWAKKFTAREARREHRGIIAEGLLAYEQDVAEEIEFYNQLMEESFSDYYDDDVCIDLYDDFISHEEQQERFDRAMFYEDDFYFYGDH